MRQARVIIQQPDARGSAHEHRYQVLAVEGGQIIAEHRAPCTSSAFGCLRPPDHDEVLHELDKTVRAQGYEVIAWPEGHDPATPLSGP